MCWLLWWWLWGIGAVVGGGCSGGGGGGCCADRCGSRCDGYGFVAAIGGRGDSSGSVDSCGCGGCVL